MNKMLGNTLGTKENWKKILAHHDRMLAAFFIPYIMLQRVGEGIHWKYILRKHANRLQGIMHKQVCLLASLQVLGGEDLFLDPRP
jgi:hypothetical protein